VLDLVERIEVRAVEILEREALSDVSVEQRNDVLEAGDCLWEGRGRIC
jgi:hypothetical protein